ncbi:hypothetical protein HMPREF1126_1267 [Streptococcus anginosus SK1138]|uniref:Uncharacterized protein n=1 Tax=Streptococcus anginosus SK1138 TaxID=1161422 RepID=A0AAD2T9Q3_STRAP|nr:hypothetical protein [Streptococcus anginosus]EJP27226.1 hypothetical protein HMPREF1126_1267 [Streptococcus anginosus SK1138]
MKNIKNAIKILLFLSLIGIIFGQVPSKCPSLLGIDPGGISIVKQ